MVVCLSDAEPSIPPNCLHNAVVGVIPAAGESRRLGFDKRTLKAGHLNLVENAVRCLLQAAVPRVVIVLGPSDSAGIVAAHRGDERVLTVHIPITSPSMMSTIQYGIAALGERAAIVLMPCDCPGISTSTVSRLVARFVSEKAGILVPTFDGRSGHPRLMSSDVVQELVKFDRLAKVSAFIAHKADCVDRVEVDDPFVTRDIDTIADAIELQRLGVISFA